MQEDMLVQPNYLGKVENYRFAGIDSTHVGAIKSVADYYQIPLSTAWIYGMTGIAFLHVLGDSLIEPNGGPPESRFFKLQLYTDTIKLDIIPIPGIQDMSIVRM